MIATSPFAIPPGVTFCAIDGRLVFLDIGSDRYFQLSQEAETAFLRLWNGTEIIGRKRDPGGPGMHVHNRLIAAGVIEPAPVAARPVACAVVPASRELTAPDATPRPGAVVAGLAAIHLARCELKVAGLSRTIERLARRKTRLARNGHRCATPDVTGVATAFDACARVMSAYGRCLPWSIALAHRLIAAGAYPQLVLGVRLRPFRAHAWVQVEQTLINEQLELTRNFTPILTV